MSALTNASSELVYENSSEGVHTLTLTMNEAMIDNWAKSYNDFNPVHMDINAARKVDQNCPGRIAHGQLVESFAGGLYTHAVGSIAIPKSRSFVRYRNYICAGDTIRYTLKVCEDSTRKKIRTIKTLLTITRIRNGEESPFYDPAWPVEVTACQFVS